MPTNQDAPPPPALESRLTGPTGVEPTTTVDLEDWLALLDQALQGLHHALNNRIGTLSALVELTELNELPADGSASKRAASDLERLEECNKVVHLLRRDRAAGEEALVLDDVLDDAYVIHRYLHDVRDVQVTASPEKAAEPIRVERWALVRVLTLLLYDARRLAKRLDKLVRTSTRSDEQWVHVEFRVGENHDLTGDVPESAGGRYAECVATAFGGDVQRYAGGVVVRVPTLKARRAAKS